MTKSFLQDKEWLYQKYVVEQLSMYEIARLINKAYSSVNYYIHKYGITVRTLNESATLFNNKPGMRERMKQGNLNKIIPEHQKKILSNLAKQRTGKKNPNWKPPEERKTDLNFAIRASKKSKEWRKSVIVRDNYTCVHCSTVGGKLHIDHIVPLSFLINDNKIKCLEDAFICETLWDINNGRTLCKSCHKKTDTYCRKALKYKT